MKRHMSTLGTRLRHLIELLDGDVNAIYAEDGLAYRARYTPVVRALQANGPSPIKAIAAAAAISHSAASQTVAQMRADGLVALLPGADGRERIVAMTPALKRMIPKLERRWRATNAAAAKLDKELSTPLTQTIEEAVAALERRPFADRIRDAERRSGHTSARRRMSA
jgi:DNA-binding MarR family transcriptional regulator